MDLFQDCSRIGQFYRGNNTMGDLRMKESMVSMTMFSNKRVHDLGILLDAKKRNSSIIYVINM